jgi:hypothetical protein
MGLSFFIKIQQHDHEKEQNHDRARVNNDVNSGKELSIQ